MNKCEKKFSPDECSQLPNISNLETDTQFPVNYNGPVTVKCSLGYSLEGSDVITCIKEKNYKSIDGYLPACNESKNNQSLKGSRLTF